MRGTTKNPGVAAVLSFIIPGMGHVYNGRIFQGVFLLFLYLCALASITVFVGFILAPLIWIISIFDAYRDAERINRLSLKKVIQ